MTHFNPARLATAELRLRQDELKNREAHIDTAISMTVPPRSDIPALEQRHTQQHYTITELAKMWKLSYSTIQRMFRGEPGVLHLMIQF